MTLSDQINKLKAGNESLKKQLAALKFGKPYLYGKVIEWNAYTSDDSYFRSYEEITYTITIAIDPSKKCTVNGDICYMDDLKITFELDTEE